MKVKKQQLEPYMEQLTGSKLEKEDKKAVYCHTIYLTYMQNTSCKMPGWMSHKLESYCWEKYQQPQTCRWYHSNGRKQRRTKETLDKGERGMKKVVLKLNIKETKIMKTNPITSWQIEEEKVEAVTDFLFLGSKITADCHCSHETRRHLLLGWKLIAT